VRHDIEALTIEASAKSYVTATVRFIVTGLVVDVESE
jgi:hypothetical protein